MKCIQCGNEIPEEARFCPNCGAENFAPSPQEEVVNPVVEPQPVEVNAPIPPLPPEPPRPEPPMSVEPPRPVEPINNGPVVPPQPKEEIKKSHNKVYIIIIAILSVVIIGLVCVLIFGEDWGIMCNDNSSTRETDKSDSKDKDSSSKDKDDDKEESPSKDPDENVPSVETTTQKIECNIYDDGLSGTYTFSAIGNEIVGLNTTLKYSYEYLDLDYETLTAEEQEMFKEEIIKNIPENLAGIKVNIEFTPSTIDLSLNVDFTTVEINSLEDLDLGFDGTEGLNLEKAVEQLKSLGAICY